MRGERVRRGVARQFLDELNQAQSLDRREVRAGAAGVFPTKRIGAIR
jgi:hypothetical protein